MSEGSSPKRPSIGRRHAVRAAGAVGVMLVMAAVLGPSLLTTKPAPSPSASSAAVATHSSPSATPAASLEPWPDLAVGPYTPLAQLTPTDRDRAGVATRSSFSLRSLGTTPAVELAAGLRIDPPLAFEVEAGASAAEALIRPNAELTPGLRYRFRLDGPDGSLAGTWAFTARRPFRIVGTLPGDQAVDVPTNTGIEVTFDQDGATGVADHVTIEPAVAGRFEPHGRTWAFVPDKPLAAATIYTVIVAPGIAMSGSDQVLAAGTTFQFETSAAGQAPARISFGRAILEVRPDRELIVAVDAGGDPENESGAPEAVSVRIHRLPTWDALVAAATSLAGALGWAIASPSASVPTTDLPEVAKIDAELIATDEGHVLHLPLRLAAGSYVATIDQPGAPAQLLLQVTNLSAYALTGTADSIVWVNDLARAAPVAGASVSVAGGQSLGKTDASGVAKFGTPNALRVTSDGDEEHYRAARFIEVAAADGRRLLVPIGLAVSYFYEEGGWYGGYDSPWWLLFRTDRTAYRQTDTIHAYGLVRARSDRTVPDDVELRLRPVDGPPEAPILRVPVTPTARGVFTGDLLLDDLPRATYMVDLFVGTERVSSAWIAVTEIRKPAYGIDATTDRRVYIAGDQVRVSTQTSFFDGTVVPEMELRISGFDQTVSATTGTQGEAAGNVRARFPADQSPEGWTSESIGAIPANPEEGQVGGSVDVVVFPSRVWLDARASITDGRIAMSGTLSWVDLARIDADLTAGRGQWDLGEPAGGPVPGGSVQATVTHLIPERRQVGTTYDYIEKKVVPNYDYTIKEVSLGTSTLKAAADGTFRLSMAAPVREDTYRITLSAVDPEGRTFKRVVEAWIGSDREESGGIPHLEVTGPAVEAGGGFCGGPTSAIAGLDSPFDVTLRLGDGTVASGGRFLFIVGRLGSMRATVQDAATLRRTLREADLPNLSIRAVWLDGEEYVAADAIASVDPDDKSITIKLSPDRASYRPGDTVSIDVTATDPAGRPVVADVVVQGVDEKLYELGLASDDDPRDALLSQIPSGFLQAYRTHSFPSQGSGGCGAEGGGDRDDFRDTVTFQRITTDAAGRGTVTFGLSDDLTSWHMTAVAMSGALDSGHASVLVPVSLPFFVEAVLAPEYLVGDLPVLRLRAYGGALASGDPVEFVVEAPDLGLAPTSVAGTAFTAVRVALPAMTAGDHAIHIKAAVSHDGVTLRDSMTRTIRAVESRLASLARSYDLLEPGFRPQGGDGLTTYVITDAGRGRLISLLEDLASTNSARFDRGAAAQLARALLIEEYGFPEAAMSQPSFDAERYQQGGIALLPYSSGDLFLSARAALVASTVVDVGRLGDAFSQWVDEEQANRERQIVGLAGLAGIGDDVLERLRTYDPATLSLVERLWLGLAFAASGDEAAARAIERAILEANGQQLGPWVRLAVGTTIDDTLEPSGLMLMLAARLGDPVAHGLSQYLVDHPSREIVFPLEQMGYVQGMLDWLPRIPGRFAWTVGGERHEVDLAAGGGVSLTLTKGQRSSLVLERLAGELAVVTAWTATDAPLPSNPAVTITRTVTPAGNAPDNRLVRVRFEVRFAPSAPNGCYRLTDLLPSGLAPVVGLPGWDGGDGMATSYPYEGDGQRVSWCVEPSSIRIRAFSYAARVVTPGTYRWEPAVVQSELAPSIGASTAATTYTIR